MTVSTTATIPTDAAFEVLAPRRRRTLRRPFGNWAGTETVDQLVESMPAHQHPASKLDAGVIQRNHLQSPELNQGGREADHVPGDSIPVAGNELVERQPRRCS